MLNNKRKCVIHEITIVITVGITSRASNFKIERLI